MKRLLISLLVLGTLACDEAPRPSWRWDLPQGVPAPVVPADNPMTVEKVELGRMLFYDRRLSSTQMVSCATCHQQRHAFADGRGVSRGVDGRPHPRQSPPLANAAYNAAYNWASPNVTSIEAQLAGPLFGHDTPVMEHGLVDEASRAAALAQLRADERYTAAFSAAYPDVAEPSMDEVVKALASFVRSLVSFDSAVDRFRRGDATALDSQQRRGLELFDSHEGGAVCHHCHSGLTFAANVRHERAPSGEVAYVNVGLYNLGPNGAYPSGNQGLYESTKRDADRGRFRVPTMRNVAVTAPYMHDGSVATIDDVIDVYANAGRYVTEGPHAGDGRGNPNLDSGLNGMTLSAADRAALRALFDAFTDEAFLADPKYANPYPDDPWFGE